MFLSILFLTFLYPFYKNIVLFKYKKWIFSDIVVLRNVKEATQNPFKLANKLYATSTLKAEEPNRPFSSILKPSNKPTHYIIDLILLPNQTIFFPNLETIITWEDTPFIKKYNQQTFRSFYFLQRF